MSAEMGARNEISPLDYRILLSKINRQLEECEQHTLKYLCRDESINLKRGPLGDCEDSLGVFEMLERKTYIGSNNLGLLVELLDILDQDALKAEVETKCGTVKVKKTISTYRRTVVKYAGMITEKEFGQLKRSLGNDLPSARKEELKYPIQLMSALENTGKIAPGKVECLKSYAEMLHNTVMKDIIQAYKQEIVIERYKMDREPRGLCIIINNIDFSNSTTEVLENRTGSEQDQEKLKKTFQDLKFNVVEKMNLKAAGIVKVFEELKDTDLSNSDCFVCCIMSHGNSGYVCGVDGEIVKIVDIAHKYVSASACPTLAYKPKLFFIESCRGNNYDTKYDPEGINYFKTSTAEDNNSNSMATGGGDGDTRHDTKVEGSIPEDADFLFAYASSPGRKAKLTSSGSIYMKKLTEVLDGYSKDFDILSMLTLVNRKVCEEEFEEPDSDSGRRTGITYGQAPAPQFTLRKKLYFN